MQRPTRTLLVYPRFVIDSFWSLRATCALRGARHPSIPLGLLTVAALLPKDWELRLVDCNVERLRDRDIAWADFIFVGGMLPQQGAALQIIERAKALGKTVVVGGPDATGSPEIYDRADHLVLGEAEVTLPRWLADLQAGEPAHVYEAGETRANVRETPPPRYELLKLDRYLYPSVQFGRGCPFLCEFCDIIELFGRVPRLKSPEQLLHELDLIYELGHRGPVDFVDDNFVGNKRDVKKFLPELIAWQQARGMPFEFSTEASVNLADDDELLNLMQDAGFLWVFVGIESPDEQTLISMQKRQNTRRQLATSIEKINRHGMIVNTGYIIGFDDERQRADLPIIELIEASATPVNMVGLLFALPGTQLSRRLAREGRLNEQFAHVAEYSAAGDQCSHGINFRPLRARADILRDYRNVIEHTYRPDRYFARVERVVRLLDHSRKRLNFRWRDHARDMLALAKLSWKMGVVAGYRRDYWRVLIGTFRTNLPALRACVSLISMYLHYAQFVPFVLRRLDAAIDSELTNPSPVAPRGELVELAGKR